MSRKDATPRAGERNRGHVRCGCNARLLVVKQQTGNGWVVSTFVEEHNHPLATPSRVHLLRSHWSVSKTKKDLVQQFSEANIPTCQQVRLLEIDAGGPSSLGCVEKDIRNYQRDVRHEMLGHDAETLIEHFTFEKEKNPNFVFDYETDDENKFVRCFWADCESRRSYAYFGDVVMFDTTYNTNSLDNTNQPQYSQDPSDQQYQAPDPQYAYQAPDSHYAYHAPDSQYSYHASDPQYAYHAPDPPYAYHAPNRQYSITGSNNASYSLDPQEYDARYNTRN
ncbi:Protein FAR1-RELATED SEQUENCE 5 [Abeliophyllum distichum]|uniref:Protein FAR1-RELATED SEQUENCE 5 n=1 Tax=Abeliophyllum distichum TaxID=126358 RepID=A0ABD1T096_9LAMI